MDDSLERLEKLRLLGLGQLPPDESEVFLESIVVDDEAISALLQTLSASVRDFQFEPIEFEFKAPSFEPIAFELPDGFG